MNAHDVRHLRVCTKCGRIGDRRHMVEMPPLDDDGDGFWWHGRCFIAAKGVDALLMLPIAQLDGLQLSDIGRKAMTAILDRKEWN